MEQQITIKQRAKRRSALEIQSLLEAFTRSGISVQSFCDEHNIGKSTFHKWQSRYNNKQHQTTSQAFAGIEIVSDSIQHGETLFAEVKGIKIYQPVSAAYLKALLT